MFDHIWRQEGNNKKIFHCKRLQIIWRQYWSHYHDLTSTPPVSANHKIFSSLLSCMHITEPIIRSSDAKGVMVWCIVKLMIQLNKIAKNSIWDRFGPIWSKITVPLPPSLPFLGNKNKDFTGYRVLEMNIYYFREIEDRYGNDNVLYHDIRHNVHHSIWRFLENR